ncbi:MAG: DUF1566 domain-containing protein [Chlorobiaceae bacterium]|jgi:hypothetical protein
MPLTFNGTTITAVTFNGTVLTALVCNGSTVWSAAAAPVVGAAYGGGICGYILVAGDPGYSASTPHGLIVAAEDQAAVPYWSNITSAAVTGTSANFGTGAANTTKIIAQAGHTASAAKNCRTYNGGGFNNWYLPSEVELEKLCINCTAIGVLDPEGYYWTSTERSASLAEIFSFYDGWAFDDMKIMDYASVRAVRSF